MAKKFNECDPQVCNWDFIISKAWDIMYKEVIKDQCECLRKALCFEALRHLNEKRIAEAIDVLSGNPA